MSSVYDLFKSAGSSRKPYISFDNLPIGDYFIKSFSWVGTKFGNKIRADIGENVVFLPQRYVKNVGEDNIEAKLSEMNKGKYWLIYRGKDTHNNNEVMMDIISADDYSGSALDLLF